MPAPQLIARGNILPSRFVMADTATSFGVKQATANAPIVGISQVGTNYPPINDPAITIAGYAAVDGQTVRLFGEGDSDVLLMLSDTLDGNAVAAGDYLMADSVGRGVKILTVTGDAVRDQNYGAIALQAGGESELIRVQIVIGKKWTPVS